MTTRDGLSGHTHYSDGGPCEVGLVECGLCGRLTGNPFLHSWAGQCERARDWLPDEDYDAYRRRHLTTINPKETYL